MKVQFDWPVRLPKSQFSQFFIQAMLNRVAVGFIRFGDVHTSRTKSVKVRISKALDRYVKTGNKEMLVDIANYAMLEFINPKVENTHFSPSDSDPTPSLVRYFHDSSE